MKRQKGVNSFKGIGTRKHPYKIETDFGGGTFYDARNGFNKKQYPKWIEQNFCYSNCLQFILLTNKDCQLLSGICYMEKPFLHSVILINDKIIDFNYHVVMDKGLYFALTKFECLAELDSNHVRETTNFVLSKKDVLSSSNLTSLTINFAYDDVLEYLSNEQRQLDEPDIGI